MSTQRNITVANALSILNSRALFTRNHIGQQVLATVQGKGTFVSAAQQEDEQPGQKAYFDKHIYNLKANSAEAISRKETKSLLKEAIAAEKLGDEEATTIILNKWLNACQISFNQIADRGRKLEDGDMVTAIIGETPTKAGHMAIVVNNVRYKAPVAVEKVVFDMTDLVGDDEEVEEVAAPAPAPAAKPAKKAK